MDAATQTLVRPAVTRYHLAVHPPQPKRLPVADRLVGDDQPCFIAAEIGQNHNGEMAVARRLIEMAAACGATAVKFQKRDVAGELSAELRQKPYDNENSFGATYGEHRERLELSPEQHRELQQHAHDRGLLYFCTVCDVASLDALRPLDLPLYKVASRDITNWPLLDAIARTGRPVILSTGMAGADEVDAAVERIARRHDRIVVAQCTSEYPSPPEHANLNALRSYRLRYDLLVGMSDHTPGIMTAVAAATLGACYVEKHVTLSRAMRGTDHAGSLEEEGLRRLVGYIRQVESAMGDGNLDYQPYMDRARRKLAKSLCSRRDLQPGDVLHEDDLELRCPGTGIAWPERHELIGRRALRPVAKESILNPSDFE